MAEPPEREIPRHRQGFLAVVEADTRPFALRPVILRDPTTIPPRQWVYGTQLVRGYVSLLVAPGGTGKSSYVLAMMLAITLGRNILGTKVWQKCRTALLNLEDPQDEIDRRLAALASHYNIYPADLDDRFLMSPADRKVTIASRSHDGFETVFPDEVAITEKIKEQQIGAIGVDPFSECHSLEENSNPDMISAAAAWRRVARNCNCAVLLVHHVRKGDVDSIEAARGAKALSDSARVGLIMRNMNEKECDTLGVPESDRLEYVRVDDAKANLARRASKASWYHLNNSALDNGTPEYPAGDQVVVIEAWQPPSMWTDISTVDCNTALDRIAAGLPDGSRYTHSRAGGERWAGQLLMDLFAITEGQAANMLRVWFDNDVVRKEEFYDGPRRKKRVGLIVVEAHRPGVAMAT